MTNPRTARHTLSILAAIGGMIAISTGASAADLSRPVYTKAPPPPPPVFSWTGFYVGGTVGAARTKADVSMSTVNNTTPGLYNPLDIPSLNAFGSPHLSQTNAIFGLKAGYNQPWGAFVLGLEGDISSFHFSPTVANAGNPFVTFPGAGSAQISTNVQTSWLATIRRAGFAVDHWLFYGTGVAAFEREVFELHQASRRSARARLRAATARPDRTAGAAGAGIDYALYPH